ncbi:50S ribosomal protein L24 [Candidatus Parcubacteria bacterium]|nr:50S ribosomal protein L24 [Candidatus Parcubacteria bacterium]
MKIKSNDKVKIISGKDKGKSGKVTKVISETGKIIVENVNLVKKHVKGKRQGEQGQKITVASPINMSNVSLICPKCTKPTRVGYLVLENGEKHRICKKCNQDIAIQVKK